MAIKDFVILLVNRLISYLQSRAVQPISLPPKLPMPPVSTSDGLLTFSPSSDSSEDLGYDSVIKGMPPKIIKLAQLINQYEGNRPNDRATRNNNPGNCRYSPTGYLAKYGVVKKDKDGFAIFSTPSIGWMYLENLLLNWAKGARKDWTILELMKGKINLNSGKLEGGYAPGSDNNNPSAYAGYLTRYLGVDANTRLKELL